MKLPAVVVETVASIAIGVVFVLLSVLLFPLGGSPLLRAEPAALVPKEI